MFGTAEIVMIGFDYLNASEIALIKRGLELLYSTPAGTCPGDRRFGLDQTFLDSPINVAQNLFSLEVIEKTEYYYPEVEVNEISYEKTIDGFFSPQITIGPADRGDR